MFGYVDCILGQVPDYGGLLQFIQNAVLTFPAASYDQMIYEDPVTSIDSEKQTLTTNSGKLLKYGSLIIATGCTASRYVYLPFTYPSIVQMNWRNSKRKKK